MKKKIPFITLLFFILVYANQGLSDLPSQCIYYLTRETWHLSATMLGLISLVAGLAWYIKPLIGFVIDYYPIKKYKSKYYLYINYFMLLLISLYIIVFGFNLLSLIILMAMINLSIAFNDVANDVQMVKLEKKYKLQGKIQAIQWTSLGIAGLIVAIGGAWIANTFPEPINYKLATGLWALLPLFTLIYLFKYYKESKVRQSKKVIPIKDIITKVKNKELLFGLLFIACLNFSPSFGTALFIHCREVLHIDKMFLGYVNATGTVLGIVGYILYYWKIYKYPLRKLLYFTIVFGAISNLFYLYIPNQWALIIYNLIFGAFSGITFLVILNFFVHLVPTGVEGLFYALIVSVNNLTARLGIFFGGVIYDKLGYSWNVIIASATTLMCLYFVPKLQLESIK